MRLTWTRIRIPLVLVVLALIPPLYFDPSYTYISRLFVLVLMFAVLAMALNLVFGHTDQLFLFIGALTGLGAYATAITADSIGVSPWVTLLPGAILVGMLGMLVSYVAARRRFTVIVIAILTLSLQLAIVQMLVGARDLTGGSTGFGFDGLGLVRIQDAIGLHEHTILFYIFLVMLVGTMLLHEWIRRSRFGLAFAIIRQDEIAGRSIGVNVVRYKSIAGFAAAFIVGLVGPIYAQLEGYIFPTMFEFQVIDVLVLIILIIGGLRTLLGPIVGATFMIALDHRLQDAGQWRLFVFGVLLIVLFLFFRQGIVPFLDEILNERLGLKRRLGLAEES